MQKEAGERAPLRLARNLNYKARTLLSPQVLLLPDHVLGFIDRHEISHGVYGWWFDHSLPLVPRDGCIELDGKRLLYIGIAPSSPKSCKSGRTLSHRINNHLRGGIGNSTLRLSLASLLKDELHFDFWRVGKKARMSPENEVSLSNWMREHAQISIADVAKPWFLEDEIIAHGPMLPLNLRKNRRNPFYPTLSAVRKQLGR